MEYIINFFNEKGSLVLNEKIPEHIKETKAFKDLLVIMEEQAK